MKTDKELQTWLEYEIAWHSGMLKQHQRMADAGHATGAVMIRARQAMIVELKMEMARLSATARLQQAFADAGVV